MRLNKKILPLTVLLAVGIALTACGSSGTAASTPASSAVPASSHVAEEGVTEPINMLTWTLDDLDDTQTITFVSAAITSGVQDGKLTAKVFSCDIYKKEEIEKLAVGDKITFHEEGAAWNQFVTVAVKSIEKNDQYHLATINGGMEQPGGLDLKLEDDDTYRTMTFDDYPLYYEMGEKTMPLAGGVVLKDSSADPQAEEMETAGASAVAAAINADPDNWTVYNTTLVVQGGRVQEVRRIWVP
jgi:PKD repeat protein